MKVTLQPRFFFFLGRKSIFRQFWNGSVKHSWSFNTPPFALQNQIKNKNTFKRPILFIIYNSQKKIIPNKYIQWKDHLGQYHSCQRWKQKNLKQNIMNKTVRWESAACNHIALTVQLCPWKPKLKTERMVSTDLCKIMKNKNRSASKSVINCGKANTILWTHRPLKRLMWNKQGYI